MTNTGDQIVLCVPNFSEGRDRKIIDSIASAIRKHKNITLIDIDSGESTNRTVYTIVGKPISVIEAVIDSAKIALEMIDMTKHKGEHKRLGALDVCPFIPVKNLEMKDCVNLAKICAEKLSKTLNVPCYLYGYAAKEDYRRTVSDIRQGEYEGLKLKLQDPKWKPDFGGTEYTPNFRRYGATMVGARKILIAYNINLIGTKEQANKLAFDIRENGRGKDQPGLFEFVQAMGWTLEERNISQVTINLTDYEVTSIHQVWNEVNRLAKEYFIPICGSEIVGVVPLDAILKVADHFIKSENILILEEDLKVQYAISKLGLNFLNEFKPREKIIEYILEDQAKSEKLIDLTLKGFINQVRSRNAVPGGGSVSALIGSLASSLVTMVGRISSGRKKFECNDNLMKQVLPSFYDAADQFLKYVDLDSEAFTKVLNCVHLPETTQEEREFKQSYHRNLTLNTINVPLQLMNEAFKLMNFLEKLCPVINMNAKSDLQVAIISLRTCIYGAYFNCIINLDSIDWSDGKELKNSIESQVTEKIKKADILEQKLLNLLNSDRSQV